MGAKITVLLPTYNRATTFLPDAIASVLTQTYKNFELMVGDNCSTDNTEEFVKSFKDKRIKYFKAKENTGTPNTFINKASRTVKSKYIAFLDDDARFFPKHLEMLIAKAEEGYRICHCYAINSYIDSHFNVSEQLIRGKDFDRSSFIAGGAYYNYIDQSDILLDRKAFIEFGGIREDAGYQDYAIVAKLCMKHDVGVVTEILTEHLIHKIDSDYTADPKNNILRINIF